MKVSTNFDNLPLGPIGQLILNAPAASGAMLIGSMEVIPTPNEASGDPGEANWGTRSLHINGEAQLVAGGPIRTVGFACGIRSPLPNPSLNLMVLDKGGKLLSKHSLTPELDGQQLPAFGNGAVTPTGAGFYGTGTISGDVIGEIVLGD